MIDKIDALSPESVGARNIEQRGKINEIIGVVNKDIATLKDQVIELRLDLSTIMAGLLNNVIGSMPDMDVDKFNEDIYEHRHQAPDDYELLKRKAELADEIIKKIAKDMSHMDRICPVCNKYPSHAPGCIVKKYRELIND